MTSIRDVAQDIAQRTRESRRAQGLPPHVSDAAALRRVAALVGATETETRKDARVKKAIA